MKTELIEKAYAVARERFAAIGVDTFAAMQQLQKPYIPAILMPKSAQDREFLNSLIGGKGQLGTTDAADPTVMPSVKEAIESSTGMPVRKQHLWACIAYARMVQVRSLRQLLMPRQQTDDTPLPPLERLVLAHELAVMPVGAVYDFFNMKHNIPVGEEILQCIRQYNTEQEP